MYVNAAAESSQGTVSALKHLVAWAMHNYDRVSTLGDQSVIAEYWLEHPDMRPEGDICYMLAFNKMGEAFKWCLLRTDHCQHVYVKDEEIYAVYCDSYGMHVA